MWYFREKIKQQKQNKAKLNSETIIFLITFVHLIVTNMKETILKRWSPKNAPYCIFLYGSDRNIWKTKQNKKPLTGKSLDIFIFVELIYCLWKMVYTFMSVTNIYISKTLALVLWSSSLKDCPFYYFRDAEKQMYLILTDHNFVRIKLFTTFTDVYNPGYVK